MARKKLITNQTKEELAFEMAAKMLGKPVTSADVRFYMRLTKIVEKEPDFKISDIAKLADEIYNISSE